ncbi:TPA: hypothetical protein ACN341_004415 [Vibrio parahaemolyticus]|nr:hypothetical protein [Vibrio parahaemolyticus]HCE2175507.1 hypothetical protein [Vibrio parahaemolyticus]HCG7995816.1 hypothetical protein [Vibrio parahaemolyticus]
MDSLKILGVILGSSVLAALITAIFTRKSHEDNVSLKYITEERAKWRQKVKELVSELIEAVHISANNRDKVQKVRSISAYLKLSLNPDPEEKLDSDILTCLNEICLNPNYSKVRELEVLVSKLLKHDWERAKKEAKSNVSPLELILVGIPLVWCVVRLTLTNTELYKQMQSIPVLSGSYTEIACSSFIIFLGFYAFGFAKKCVSKSQLAKWKKT